MPAFDFPNAPSDGDIYEGYIYDGTRGVWNVNQQQANARFTVSSTAPSNPVTGDAWFDTTDGTTYVYYYDGDTGQWVETGNPVLSYVNMDGLTDVTAPTPTDGDILVYNGSSGEWENNPQEVSLGLVIALG